jgi:hypothetical protein
MYPPIPWEMVTDPLGSAEHNLGTTGLAYNYTSRSTPVQQHTWSS